MTVTAFLCRFSETNFVPSVMTSECEVNLGCKLGAKRTQIAPSFADFDSPNHPIAHLECVAGTTGLEPATSAPLTSARTPAICEGSQLVLQRSSLVGITDVTFIHAGSTWKVDHGKRRDQRLFFG
jgi:hypothetical protein